MIKLFCLILAVPLLVVGCASPQKEPTVARDEQLDRFTTGARRAFDRGELRQALSYYQAALERAYVLDDPREIGNAAYNYAASLMAEGDYNRAAQRLDEAERELSRARENLADLFVVQARLALLRGQPERALFYADQTLRHRHSAPDPEHHILARVIQGEIAAGQGDASSARRFLQAAESHLTKQHGNSLLAGVEGLRGRIFEADNQSRLAAQAFDREAALWRASGRYNDMVNALERAAAAHFSAGAPDHAADRLLRAGRSSFAQGDEEFALGLLDRALSVARAPGLRRQIAQATERFHAAGSNRGSSGDSR